MIFGMIDLIEDHENYRNMKNILTVFFLFFLLTALNAQEVSLRPKFFTLRNARLSTGLGFEGGYNRYIGFPDGLRSVIDSSKFGCYSLSFDLYAPNSFLGFMVEANYMSWDLTLRKSYNNESFDVRTLEIPFFLKFRFGHIEKNGRIWILAGASYIIPLAVYRQYNNERVDQNISQVNAIKVLSGMIGWEQYLGERKDFKAKNPKGTYDRMRFVLFLRFSYALDNQFNPSYYQTSNNISILNDYQGLKFKDMSFSLGIKYFFRLGIF